MYVTDTPRQHDAVVDIIIYITDIQLVLELHSSIPFAVAILLRYIDPRPRRWKEGPARARRRDRRRWTTERGQKVLHAVCNICSFSFCATHPVTRARNASEGEENVPFTTKKCKIYQENALHASDIKRNRRTRLRQKT